MDGLAPSLLVGLLVAGGLSLLVRARAGRLIAVILGGLVAFAASRWAPTPTAPPGLPGPSPITAYQGSATCRSCHPGAYDSWQKSYHATMTQVATPQSVLAPFDGTELRDRGMHIRLEARADGSFWAHLIEPTGQVGRSRQIVMTTGSHHMQNYWMAEDGGWYVQLPFIWSVTDARWMPTQDSFLQPERPTPGTPAIWNNACVYCHTLGGASGVSPDGATAQTKVAELGITCEACHGPGEAHLARHRNPANRLSQVIVDKPDPTTVTIDRDTDSRRAVAVCGQCHGLFMRTNNGEMNTHGDRFRPGDPLDDTRQLFLPVPDPRGRRALLIPPVADSPPTVLRFGDREIAVEVRGFDRDGIHLVPSAPLPGAYATMIIRPADREGPSAEALRLPAQLEHYPGGAVLRPAAAWPSDAGDRMGRLLGYREQTPVWYDLGGFWADGTVRSTGREANAMAMTACATNGPMQCLSCHSIHQPDDFDDMLKPGMRGDQACVQCHPSYAADVSAHTHHAVGSSGSACQNCHMPHTTYGLLGAIRAHRVDSPSAARSARSGRPNACNLCHVDRTLAWTAEALAEWYDQPKPALSAPWQTVSAAVLWTLNGDAVQRAVTAWHFGWAPALAVSGRRWAAPLLSRLLDDDYAAVRAIAGKALRRQEGFAELDYDFVGPAAERRAVAASVQAAWRAQTPERTGAAVLIKGPGQADDARIDRLYQQRDRSKVHVSE